MKRIRWIRWTRTLVFDGPEDHVLKTMASSWIQATSKIKMNEMIIACTEYKVEIYESEEVPK